MASSSTRVQRRTTSAASGQHRQGRIAGSGAPHPADADARLGLFGAAENQRLFHDLGRIVAGGFFDALVEFIALDEEAAEVALLAR